MAQDSAFPPETLLEEINQNGNIQAVVECDGATCYFYLWGLPETGFGMRSVWFRNVADAPEELDVERMRAGRAPANPARYCRDPQGAKIPRVSDLRVVWLPEGNGAALYEKDEIVAIIPPWSGVDGFYGFARDAIGNGPLAWELSPHNILFDRFDQAEAYWEEWSGDLCWRTMQSSISSRIEALLGTPSRTFVFDEGNWPPREVLLINRDDSIALVTVGVSARPMPNVDRHCEDPQNWRRIELGVLLPWDWTEDAVKDFVAYLAAQSQIPWSRYTWLGSGHTLDCDCWRNPDYPAALLAREHPVLGPLPLGTLFDDPVRVLWLLPISAREREIVKEHGSIELLKILPADRWDTTHSHHEP